MPKENTSQELQEYMETYCWKCKKYDLKPNEVEQRGEPYCCNEGIEVCLVDWDYSEKENQIRRDLFSKCEEKGYFIPK